MGYITSHRLVLAVPPGYPKTEAEIIAEIRQPGSCAIYALDKDGNYGDPGKHYDVDDEVGMVAMNHPNVCFELFTDGEDGERSKDFWLDGKHYCEDWAEPVFDPAKLQ